MNESELIRFELTGKDAELFKSLFSKLTKAMESVVQSLAKEEISDEKKNTIEEVVKITQSYVQAKVQKPSIENEKLIAQITSEYATAQEKLANARRTHAEAESIEVENELRKLRAVIEAATLLSKFKIIDDKRHNNLIVDMSQ